MKSNIGIKSFSGSLEEVGEGRNLGLFLRERKPLCWKITLPESLEWTGGDVTEAVLTIYRINREEMGRSWSKWVAVKEAKGVTRFRGDKGGEIP